MDRPRFLNVFRAIYPASDRPRLSPSARSYLEVGQVIPGLILRVQRARDKLAPRVRFHGLFLPQESAIGPGQFR